MPAFYRRGDGFGMRGDNSFDGMPERLWACRLSPPAGERWQSAARDLGRTTPPNSFASPLHCLVRKRGHSRLYIHSGKSCSTAAMTRHLFVTYAWALRDSIAVTI